MTKTIFWNVDTQYDFMSPDGKLPIPNAMEISGNLEILTSLAAREGIQVINTADYHTRDSREISDKPDFKTTFPAHCMEKTDGAKYIAETNPLNPYMIHWRDLSFDHKKVYGERNIVIYKDEFDCFHPTGAPHTEEVLRIIQPERIVVYGVATNVCVDFAVTGLRERGYEVYVPMDAIKELPMLPLEETIEKWRGLGVNLTTTKMLEKNVGGK